MSILSHWLPRLVNPTRHMRNGFTPNDGAYTSLIGAQNHTLAFRKKEIYAREATLGDTTPAPNNWRFRTRTGYGTRAIEFTAVLGLSIESSAADPYINIALTEEGGATVNLELHYGATDTPGTGAPEEWSVQTGEIQVLANTAYTCLVTLSGSASSLALTANEVGHTTVAAGGDYFSTFEPSAGAPIYDSDIEKLIVGPSAMLRRNRALTAHWHLVDGAPRDATSATVTSLIDNATTGTPSSTAAGWRFNTTALATYARSTQVAVELSVYASITGGATGTVRIRDTAGTDAITINVTGASAAWHTGTGFLTVGTGQLYVPMYASNGAATLSVHAVSLNGWEA